MAHPAPLPAVPKGWQEVIIRLGHRPLPEPGLMEPPPQPLLYPDAESGTSPWPAPPALVREDKNEGPL